MSCQLYKKALIQAAASVSSPPGDLREHFDACAPCRAAFDREQILVASIDAGLQRITNAEVPPSFLPHLGVRLAQYAAMEREPVPAWVLVAASAALVFGVVIARNAQHTRETRGTERPLLANATVPKNAVGPERKPAEYFDEANAIKFKKARAQSAFVPAEQQAAISRLVDGLRKGEIDTEMLLANAADGPVPELRISPLEVSPVAITPLEDSPQEGP